MTADAKVGLLLGLFFIVIIAFLVNGLPNFIRQEHTTTADAAILTPSGPDMVLDERESWIPRLNPDNTEPPQTDPTPSNPLVLDTTDPADRVVVPELPQSSETNDTPKQIVIETTDLNQNKNSEGSVTPAVTSKSKTHTVAKGEILPVIAKKYYGDEQGNRRIVIQKLYEANKDILKSPDAVRIGDKLKIPQLDVLLGTEQTVKAPSATQKLLDAIPNMFEKVTKNETASVKEYVVRKGDNLWSIAENQLGDGKRYPEIKKINQIKDADSLEAGARIKIPAQ